MNKTQLLREISGRLEGATQRDVEAVLTTFEDVIFDTLKANTDEKITFGKLGAFKVKDVPERIGTIMMGSKKGEQYIVPEHQEIVFKMSKSSKNIQIGVDSEWVDMKI